MSKRWWCLGALTLARAAMGFQFQAVAAVGPLMAASLGLDKGQLGWLVGLYLLPGAVIALPGGLLGRRFGDKRLVLVGLALMGIGGIWLGFSQSFAEASAARSLSGIGAVMLNVLVTKMVADWFDGKERLLAMSILINSWPIGIGIALLVVGQLGQHDGWQWGMFSTAVFAAIGFAAVVAVYRAPAGAAPAVTSGLGLATLTRTEWRRLLLGSLPWLLYNASFQIMMSFMPSFFVDNGFELARATSLSAVSAIGFVVGVQAGGLLLKRSAHPDLICHAALAGWCVALLALSTGTAPLPWVVLGGLLGGLPAAALVSLPAEVLRPESRSAGMGIFFTVYYFGCAILPTVAGLLYDRAGGGAALWMAAGLASACIPILGGFRRGMKGGVKAWLASSKH